MLMGLQSQEMGIPGFDGTSTQKFTGCATVEQSRLRS